MSDTITITAKSQAEYLNKWMVTNYNPEYVEQTIESKQNEGFLDEDFENSLKIVSHQKSESAAEIM